MDLSIAGLCFTSTDGAAYGHDWRLVALSYAIAALGSYTALDMVERLRASRGRTALFWLAGSAATLGGSIWAMHFLGLLALHVDLPIAYDPVATVASLAIVVVFVAAGLQVVRLGRPGLPRFVAAGAVLGLGVAAMHYLGMAALLFPGTVAYRPGLFGVSIGIAVAAATAALWLSMNLQASWQRAAAALVMACAICGMHYTGMAATELLVDPASAIPDGVSAPPLVVAVAATTLTLLVLALVSVRADRLVFAASRRETEALRLANLSLVATQKEILRRLCLAGEYRDSDTGGHVDRIGRMSERLALMSGCSRAWATDLLVAAPLHDIGKIGISDLVLLKPGRLTPQERLDMQAHSEIGYRILRDSGVRLLDLAAEIARYHHEKWDGTGHPGQLSGTAIPLGGRIVAIVDVFDALLSRRPYKEPWPVDRAVALMRAESGRHFDPALMEVFLADLPAMLAICGATEGAGDLVAAGPAALYTPSQPPESRHSSAVEQLIRNQ